MNQMTNLEDSVFGETGSTADGNKLYSILLDTRASAVSENMYDIAEKLTKNEKENSKFALEQLWALKKNLGDEDRNSTLSLLINFYQNKLDMIRNKEKDINSVGKDSRDLLEEKRKRDAELVAVKHEISDCATELEKLKKKVRELKTKEQELILIDTQLDKELGQNANKVVNGLYEIILSSHEEENENEELSYPEEQAVIGVADNGNENIDVKESVELSDTRAIHKDEFTKKTQHNLASNQNIKNIVAHQGEEEKSKAKIVPPFPKSVVKTTRGVVIGEYFYDSKVYKNKRHYIFNSYFFYKSLTSAVEYLAQKFDQRTNADIIQMIQDAYKRISENSTLHFSVSTNEIVNNNALKEIWQKLVQREYNDILLYCNRLGAKLKALGKNFNILLIEQMNRYSDS